MKLSVIIPNYNGLDVLRKYLPHTHRLLEQELPGEYEIIVTDDHSRDGSAAFVAGLNLPNVRFVANPNERGFGSNCNHGARSASGELLFFLNNDIELQAGFFPPLLAKIAEEKVFSVVPRIMRRKDQLVESLTSGRLVPGEISTQSKNKLNRDPTQNHPVLWGCGAALLCRRDLFLSLGGFSDEFKVYYVEDTDLSLKAWRMGYENWYVGQSVALHDNSATTKKEWKWKRRFIAGINGEIFQFKHLPEQEKRFRFHGLLKRHALRLNLFRLWTVIAAYLAVPKPDLPYRLGTEEVLRRLNGQ